jgi:hypothetical protein
MRAIIFFFILFSAQFVTAQKKLVFSDKSYEEEIRTVMLYPQMQGQRDNIRPAVAPLQAQNLVLEFDDLQAQRSNYYVKIIHCNYDWTKSTLQDLDFLTDYNEYPINDYDFSANTSVPYLHYFFALPNVKLPGNYLLVAYRESDENDLLLSKRFMIFDNQVNLVTDNQSQGLGTLRTSNQQLNFKINYASIDAVNPMESIHAIVRQNQRWDNLRTNVKPSFVREDKRELEYRFFDQDNQFAAGNEFRFVDFRSLNSPGRNTGRLDRSKRPFHISVQTDQSRQDQVYAQYPDLNGNYVIENLDYREASISGDYVFVTFTLTSSQTVNGDVHLIGALNNWDHSAESKMSYQKGTYEKTLFLKQGWYDYQYWVEGDKQNAFQLEGSHFETENLYEVLIYYPPL